MKTICITGAAAPDLHIVSGILQQSGMKAALPAHREDAVDIAFWHEKVMAQAAEESSAAQAITNPGRVWEQLASEIFVANINAPVWGWADTRSTWALDYWCNFEPRFYAVLVCVSPQQMLARALATQTEAVSVDAVMAAWQQHHQELLRFHHRNPQRSLLVDVSQCAENPQALIERCVQQWKLPLAAPPKRRAPPHRTGATGALSRPPVVAGLPAKRQPATRARRHPQRTQPNTTGRQRRFAGPRCRTLSGRLPRAAGSLARIAASSSRPGRTGRPEEHLCSCGCRTLAVASAA